jgi:hypothetical protein
VGVGSDVDRRQGVVEDRDFVSRHDGAREIEQLTLAGEIVAGLEDGAGKVV